MTPPDPNLREFVATQPAATSDADVATAYNAQPPAARSSVLAGPGSTYVTYVLLGTLPAPFGGNPAGTLRTGLMAWAAGPDLSQLNPALPNPGQLASLHARLDGYPGLDLSTAAAPGLIGLLASGVPTVHPPLLTADQAAAMLAMGYVVNAPVVAADVTAARAYLADQQARAKVTAALASVLNDGVPGLPAAPTAAAVGQMVAAALAAAGVA